MAQFFLDRSPAKSAWPPEYASVPSSLPPPSSTSEDDQSSSQGGVAAGLVIGFLALLLLVAVVYSFCKWRRRSRALARTRARAAAWAAIPAAPLPLQAEPRARTERRRLVRRASTLAPTPTARLPAFTYSQSAKHNVAGTGDEAATCSVCLGAFQDGESVRLLPACLHLFHVECIDPWLDGHSTCPICRSDTDPTVDVAARLPPV